MDIGYFNARIRGMRGRLLKAGDYAIFLRSASEAEYRERLRQTAYARYVDMAEARGVRSEDIVSSAVNESAVDAFRFIWDTAPDDARMLLKTLFSRLELHNLKALVRGFIKDVKREELRGVLLPAGEFNKAALNALVNAKNLLDAVLMLKTWGSSYAAAFEGASVEGRINAFDIELRLDRFVYDRFLPPAKGASSDGLIIREMVRFQIDVQNIMTLLKTGDFSRQTVEGFFIEGGNAVDRTLFNRAAATENPQDMLDALSTGATDAGLRAVLGVADAQDFAPLEEAADELLGSRLWKAAVTGPLTIAIAASFVQMKMREMKNLRLIARAKLFDMPPEALKGVLYYRQ